MALFQLDEFKTKTAWCVESVEAFADFFMARFGPMVTARFGDRSEELREQVVGVWRRANEATDGSLRLPQEYLFAIVHL